MENKSRFLSQPDIDILRAMLEEIAHYRSGHHLPRLVSALDAGLTTLNCNQGVINGMRESWRILEEVNALALDSEQAEPLEQHVPLLESALENFEQRIRAVGVQAD